MKRRSSVLAALAFVSMATIAAAPARAAEPGPKRFATQIGNLEGAAARLVRDYANPLAIVQRFPNARRLLDARVFYELGQYENAAMLLLDVLERPDFKGDLEYDATELLLGECLLKIDNPRAARGHLLRVAQGSRDPALAEEARLYLLEVALAEGSIDTLRTAISELGAAAMSDRTRYHLGKAYVRLDEPDKAIGWLSQIPPQSELYHRGRFYLGASFAAKGQHDLALEVFRNLTQVPGDEATQQEIRDQAWLAVARLLVQRGSIELALTSYQNIGRHSPHYEDALYEMSWAYINQEKYDKALQTVEVLLLTVQDEQVDIDAHVLRGQLNVMLNDYEEAMASYQLIVDRFAPIRNELARFVKSPDDVQKYFKWLLDRRNALAALQSPLSEKTVKWLESTADFSRVSAVFDRIAGERADIRLAQATGEDLEKMLAAKNRVEMFPDLRDGWSQALVIQHQVIRVATSMLDRQAEVVQGRLDSTDAREHKDLVAHRRRLEDQGATMPQTVEAYQARQDQTARRYRELERKNFFVEQGLEDVQRQLQAVEKYLNTQQFSDDPATEKMGAARETGLRQDIEAEKVELEKVHAELMALKREIHVALKSVGTGDAASEGEKGLAAALLDAIAREGLFYDRVGARLGGTIASDFNAYGDLRGRVTQTIGTLDGVIAAIDREVGIKTAEIAAQVDNELESLTAYSAEVKTLDGDGRRIASALGDEFFRRAALRMDQVVLEADVGLLDVMWARKQDRTAELGRINEDRNRRLKQLQADLRSIKSGAADEAGEQKPLDDEAPLQTIPTDTMTPTEKLE
ncbi:MAG: tetratricopeptide repeat protein [Deltaproteobacteria bacterium]|nr:tetratricopeptide repeat protein [Deltaproteobacteria bacterium]